MVKLFSDAPNLGELHYEKMLSVLSVWLSATRGGGIAVAPSEPSRLYGPK